MPKYVKRVSKSFKKRKSSYVVPRKPSLKCYNCHRVNRVHTKKHWLK